MFVGGLNWETTTGRSLILTYDMHPVLILGVAESLQAYFSQFGKVDACTIMRDGAGRSRGFAFLTFEDAAAVNAVMVREHYLDGKIVCNPRQQQQQLLYNLGLTYYLSRSIRSARFLVLSTNALRNYLLEVWLPL